MAQFECPRHYVPLPPDCNTVPLCLRLLHRTRTSPRTPPAKLTAKRKALARTWCTHKFGSKLPPPPSEVSPSAFSP